MNYHHICNGYHQICNGYHHICNGYHGVSNGYHHDGDGYLHKRCANHHVINGLSTPPPPVTYKHVGNGYPHNVTVIIMCVTVIIMCVTVIIMCATVIIMHVTVIFHVYHGYHSCESRLSSRV